MAISSSDFNSTYFGDLFSEHLLEADISSGVWIPVRSQVFIVVKDVYHALLLVEETLPEWLFVPSPLSLTIQLRQCCVTVRDEAGLSLHLRILIFPSQTHSSTHLLNLLVFGLCSLSLLLS